MGRLVSNILATLGQSYWQTFYGCMICLGIELLWPRGVCRIPARLRAGLFWLFDGAVVVTCSILFGAALARLHLRPLISLNLDVWGHSPSRLLKFATWIAVPVMAAMIGDFFGYWLHRALHGIPILWRIHRLHHTIRDLSGWSSFSHFGEGWLRVVFVALPFALLVHPEVGYAPAIWTIVLGLTGYYQHSCTTIHFGPLRYVLADNCYHRIHHSQEPQHHNSNFANFTTLWDQLFGTAYFPEPGEWPPTGLKDLEAPQTLHDFVLFPLRPQSGAAGS